jgi:hypothetical protein
LHYISAVKNVLKAARLGPVERSSDIAGLLYWVSYHDILARFSLYYWKRSHPVKEPFVENLDLLVQNYSILDVGLVPFPTKGALLMI